MNIFLIAALIVLGIMFYAGVIVWYIAVRRRDTNIEDIIQATLARQGVLNGITTNFQLRIDRQEAEKISAYKRMEKVIGVDAYEALYYPVQQWVIILISIILAILSELFCYLTFGYSLLLYESLLPFISLGYVRWMFGFLHNRRRNKLFMQLPEILDTITRSLKIGVSIGESIKLVARDAPLPTRVEFQKLSENIALGMTVAEGIKIMAADNKLAEYKFMAIAVSLQSTTGGSIANTLENVADVVRNRVSIKLRGKALTGEARASATILTVLPILVIMALAFISPDYIKKLFTTHSGRHYFGVATVMLLMGQGIMRNMVKKTLNSVK